MDDMLTWDDTFSIVRVLRSKYPDVNLEEVSLNMIYGWTLELPEFIDDPELANREILTAIFQEWFEEVNPV